VPVDEHGDHDEPGSDHRKADPRSQHAAERSLPVNPDHASVGGICTRMRRVPVEQFPAEQHRHADREHAQARPEEDDVNGRHERTVARVLRDSKETHRPSRHDVEARRHAQRTLHP
jgi:hypothetical protein